jgi:hypothetical protein
MVLNLSFCTKKSYLEDLKIWLQALTQVCDIESPLVWDQLSSHVPEPRRLQSHLYQEQLDPFIMGAPSRIMSLIIPPPPYMFPQFTLVHLTQRILKYKNIIKLERKKKKLKRYRAFPSLKVLSVLQSHTSITATGLPSFLISFCLF